MKPNKLIVLLTTTFLILGLSSQALGDISDAALLYLRIAPGARAAGMGEAYVAIADDATSTHWNPAGLGATPLAKNWINVNVPVMYRPLETVASVKARSGGGHEAFDIWAISAQGLIRYDSKSWFNYETFETKSTQTVKDIVSSYFNLEAEEALNDAIAKVAVTNNKSSYKYLSELRDSIMAQVSEDYGDYAAVNDGFDSLLTAYNQCLVNWDRVKEMNKFFRDGMKEDGLSETEIDRINFAIEKSRNRFIPEELKIHYSNLFSGKVNAISSSGNTLVVATDDGLFVYDGKSWQTFTEERGLISKNILSLSSRTSAVFIGTDKGLLKFNGSELTPVTGEGDAPVGSITAIASVGEDMIYVVADNNLYKFNGTNWSPTTSYMVEVDETIGSVAKRFAVYNTAAEIEFLIGKIIELNSLDGDSETPLEPGAELTVPFSAGFKGAISSIDIGFDNKIWLGGEYGVIYFKHNQWILPGYTDVTVAEGETLGDIAVRTANALDAETYKTMLADINDLTDGAVSTDQTLKVFSKPTAYPINSINARRPIVQVASQFGLFEFNGSTWKESEIGGMNRGNVINVESKGGEVWYVSDRKIALKANGQTDISIMFAKWLPDLADDIYYGFLSGVTGIDGFGTVGGNITYITYGTVHRTDEFGNSIGTFEPFDVAFTASYGNQLNSNLKLGGSVKFIYSQLSTLGAGKEKGSGTASGIGFDLGMLYNFNNRLTFGTAITNIGPDVSYVDAAQSDPLPRNLAVGFAYKIMNSEYYHLLMTAEINKSLVSFDDGFDEEIKEVVHNGGFEFMYANLIAIRAGYIFDEVGDVKTGTLGLGLTPLKNFKFDFAYIPSGTEAPLANTLRISIQILP